MLSRTHLITIILVCLSSILLSGCYSRTPTIGDLEVNGDLPPVDQVLLPIGVTLNNTGSTGRDLLSDNLVFNGSFDLAKLPIQCSYDAKSRTVTTPNGFSTFYPIAPLLHGWDKGHSAIEYVASGDQKTGHVIFHPTDSVPCVLRQSNCRFSVASGDDYAVSLDLMGGASRVEVMLMSDSTTVVSSIFSAIPGSVWQTVRGEISVNTPADSAYLVVRAVASPRDTLSLQKYIPLSSSVVVDNIRLSRGSGVISKLYTLLRELDPGFVRFPSGRTANGFYPGTYPIWWRDSIERQTLQSWPIWTLEHGEMTGDFRFSDFMELSAKLKTIPILIANSGFTDPDAKQRIEDIRLLPNRIEQIFQAVKNYEHDSLIIQLGYATSSAEYEKRFSMFESAAEEQKVKASITASGSLLWNGRKFNDHVVDFAIPSVTQPDLLASIPEIYHQAEQTPEPIMLGEVHFDTDSTRYSFLPLFVLKAATLIDAEKNSDIIRGITLAPLLSEDLGDCPVIHVDGAEYTPTTLFRFIQTFVKLRGPVLRQIPDEPLRNSGLIASLTSDRDDKNFYLKAANTTRHPLTYKLKVRGNNIHFSHFNVTRFHPSISTTTGDVGEYTKYSIDLEDVKPALHEDKNITIHPYEVIIIHFTNDTTQVRCPHS